MLSYGVLKPKFKPVKKYSILYHTPLGLISAEVSICAVYSDQTQKNCSYLEAEIAEVETAKPS